MNAIAAVCLRLDIAVDFAKKFTPEELTPLFYMPLHRGLMPDQRLRCNQLRALYANEPTIFFETVVGRGVMDALLRESTRFDNWPEFRVMPRTIPGRRLPPQEAL